MPTSSRQAARTRGGQVDLDAQRFHHVGRAAFGSHAAVAVLGHAHAGAGDDERGGGGDIEGAAGVAAGAAGVDQRVALGAADVDSVEFSMKRQRLGRGADGLGEAHNLFDRLALHVQRHQQGGDLRVGALPERTSVMTARASSRVSDSRWLAMRCRASVIMGPATRVASFASVKRGSVQPRPRSETSAMRTKSRRMLTGAFALSLTLL